MAENTTEMQNWNLRPTTLERAMGRFLRGPDHSAADGGGDASGAADDAAGAGGDNAQGDVADKAPDGNDAADASLLGAADATAGDGGDGEGADADGEGGGDGEGKADDQAEGPPEAYELKVTVNVDGKDEDVPIDAELLTKATPILKELGLTNDQANKVAALVPEIQQRIVQTQADDFAALKADWAKEVQSDKEIGGAKWKETEALASKALDTFGAASVKDKDGNETNPFRKLLNESGFGNHPEMIRMFRKIGEKLGEGEFVRGEGAPVVKQDRVRTMYPNDPPKAEVKQQ